MIGRGKSADVGSCNFCSAWSSPQGVMPHDVFVVTARGASLRACQGCALALRDALAQALRGVRVRRPSVIVGRPRKVADRVGALHAVEVDVVGADARQIEAADREAAAAGAAVLGVGCYDLRLPPRPDGSRALAGPADREEVMERAQVLAEKIRLAFAEAKAVPGEGREDDDRG